MENVREVKYTADFCPRCYSTNIDMLETGLWSSTFKCENMPECGISFKLHETQTIDILVEKYHEHE